LQKRKESKSIKKATFDRKKGRDCAAHSTKRRGIISDIRGGQKQWGEGRRKSQKLGEHCPPANAEGLKKEGGLEVYFLGGGVPKFVQRYALRELVGRGLVVGRGNGVRNTRW